MIKHIVMWKLKDSAEGNSKAVNAQLIKDKLESLKGVIKEIKFMEVGINAENSEAGNYDVLLISEFESFETLEIYQKHPLHKHVGEFVAKVRETRACVDF